jgi:penicillin-binding protein 1B
MLQELTVIIFLDLSSQIAPKIKWKESSKYYMKWYGLSQKEKVSVLGMKIFRILKKTRMILGLKFIVLLAVMNSANAETSISSLEEKTQQVFDAAHTIYPEVILEEGSVVKKNEIEAFYLFTAEKNTFLNFYNENKENTSLYELKNKVPGLLQVNKNINFKNLISNDCTEVYCYQHYLSFEYIPSVFWKGLIGVEDQRYLDHRGVDFRSILRAFVTNIKKGKFEQGGSTISQQLVKNLFLTSEKTFTRKIKEIVTSFYLETKLSKEKILEAYLNEVNWGALQGIRIKGVYAASLFYFGKKPQEITPYEGAILISMLKGPGFFSPVKHLDRLKERTKIVYEKLIAEKLVPAEQSNFWKENNWKIFENRILLLEKTRPYQSIWRTLNDQEQTLGNFEKFVLIQKVQDVRGNIQEKFKLKNVEENIDGISVKVLLGPIDGSNWYSYYSKVERNKEKALKSEFHQIGSTVKPLVYSIFLDLGKKISDKVSTSEIKLKLVSGIWSPKDSHVVKEPEVTLSDALLKSLNRPVIHLASELGFENIEVPLKAFMPKLKSPLKDYPAELLGSTELSVYELKEAYSNFIRTECNKIKNGTRTIEESVLYVLSDPNLTTVEFSVDEVMQKLKFFGKTGTTNNGYDNWYVAFDGKNISIVWVGYEGERKTKSLGLYGATTAFNVFQNYYRDRGKRFSQFGCDLIK